MDFSSRGNICMSSSDKKNLHSIPFFDTYINYNYFNRGKFMYDRDNLNSKVHTYSEEGNGFIDIQNQIMNRIKAGYNLDSIERNFELSTHFRGC